MLPELAPLAGVRGQSVGRTDHEYQHDRDTRGKADGSRPHEMGLGPDDERRQDRSGRKRSGSPRGEQ